MNKEKAFDFIIFLGCVAGAIWILYVNKNLNSLNSQIENLQTIFIEEKEREVKNDAS